MTNLALKKVSEEVFIAEDDIVRLDYRAVDFVKAQALSNARGRARICAHKTADDALHEMIIAIRADSYIRPHRHHNKVESFHLIEGDADIVILDNEGEIQDIIHMGLKGYFYYRLSTPHFHTLIIHSPVLVIHEITNGPFNVGGSDYASYSPGEEAQSEVHQYRMHLKNKVSFQKGEQTGYLQ